MLFMDKESFYAFLFSENFVRVCMPSLLEVNEMNSLRGGRVHPHVTSLKEQ
jgi:hypothetical protein